ncbi:MAG: MFS transporter [Candidatus Gastranaerophilales bacterium]|nr:MFS transporter [Candidatus Gastranaerophilales bacterium]
MAKLRSTQAGANILIGGVVFVLTTYLAYKQIFFLLSIVICIGAIWGLGQNPASEDIPLQHKKMIFKKRYWLYYVLTMFAGARRQIFVAFAVFLLVKKFGFTVKEITVLFLINNLVTYIFVPYVGKMINKMGERFVLSVEYLSLIFVFLTYAFATSKWVVAFMYILDHIFFGFAIAIQSYFQKTADKSDIAPSMAVGFTINHLVAVALPVIGGILWMIDYKIPFIFGAFLSLCSLLFVQKIKILT